eukprot:jgi/Mesvir1/719/Mv17327-RA.1
MEPLGCVWPAALSALAWVGTQRWGRMRGRVAGASGRAVSLLGMRRYQTRDAGELPGSGVALSRWAVLHGCRSTQPPRNVREHGGASWCSRPLLREQGRRRGAPTTRAQMALGGVCHWGRTMLARTEWTVGAAWGGEQSGAHEAACLAGAPCQAGPGPLAWAVERRRPHAASFRVRLVAA